MFVNVADLLTHAAGVFNACSKEMDSKMCRLALFLEPRYSKAAYTEPSWPELLAEVSSGAG